MYITCTANLANVKISLNCSMNQEGMNMRETSDFKKGLKLMVEGNPYVIVDFQHVKPGKGNQFTRTKLKNLLNGSNLERTFKSGEKFEVPNVESKDMNFLYKDENGFHFMDPASYEQLALDKDVVGEASNFLTENLSVTVHFYNNRVINVVCPNTVLLKVVQTDPGFKGNTVTGANKSATLETNHVVQVPLHISIGDILKVDTRNGEYLERFSK